MFLDRRPGAAPHTESLERAIAAQELDSRAALELFPAADRDDANRAATFDVGATVYHTLGIEASTPIRDSLGRELALNYGQPIRALFGE